MADSKLCQDFSTALKILTLSHPNSESNGTKVVDVADKALEMASLLSHFNHKCVVLICPFSVYFTVLFIVSHILGMRAHLLSMKQSGWLR